MASPSSTRKKRSHNDAASEELRASKRSRLVDNSTIDIQLQIRLEEEILLLEQSMATLNQRKQSIDAQLQEDRRTQLGLDLDRQTDRKQHLDSSQIKHQNLLQELQNSLSKSHEILQRLNSEGANPEEIELLTREIQRQEERTSHQQKEQLEDISCDGEDIDIGGASPVQLWLFLDGDNLDWLLAVDSMDLSTGDYSVEKVFIRGENNGKNKLLVETLLGKHSSAQLETWPPLGEVAATSPSTTRMALVNLEVDRDFLEAHQIQYIMSTKGLSGHRFQVSHSAVGGITTTRQHVAVCHLDDDNDSTAMELKRDFVEYLLKESDSSRNTIQSILDPTITEFQFQVPSTFPNTVEPLRTVILNGTAKPPIYHSGGLLPPIPVPDDTLIGCPEMEGIWRVRSLTREEVLRAYDVEESTPMMALGDGFVPLRILRASLKALLQVLHSRTNTPPQQPQALPYSCPIVAPVQDEKRLEQFWKGHCQSADPQCLWTFAPAIGDPAILQNIMNVYATEALMKDAACGEDVEAAATARRQTLWNTCLDFVLMAGSSSEVDGTTSSAAALDDNREDPIDMEDPNKDTQPGAENTKPDDDPENDMASTIETSAHLDPNVALCPYELAGVCADPYCPYQHLNKKTGPQIVPREMLALPPFKLPEDPAKLEDVTMEESNGEGGEGGSEEGETEDGADESEDEQQIMNDLQAQGEADDPPRVDDQQPSPNDGEEQEDHVEGGAGKPKCLQQSPGDLEGKTNNAGEIANGSTNCQQSPDDEEIDTSSKAGNNIGTPVLDKKEQLQDQLAKSLAEELASTRTHQQVLAFLATKPAGMNSRQVKKHMPSLLKKIQCRAQEAGIDYIQIKRVLPLLEGVVAKFVGNRTLFYSAQTAPNESGGTEPMDESDYDQSDSETEGGDSEVTGEQSQEDEETDSASNAGETNDVGTPADEGHGESEEFESNLDFVAFGDVDQDGAGEEEEFLTLETAGLVGLGRRASKVQNPDDDANLFWWQSNSQESTQLLAFEAWLLVFAEFHVGRSDADDTASMEYRGSRPSNPPEMLAFAGKIVDCARLMVHAGRFDLTEPLCTISRNVLKDYLGVQSQQLRGFFQDVVIMTSETLDFAYSNQNGARSTFRSQLVLAIASDFLLALHDELLADEDGHTTNWAGCTKQIDGISHLLSGTGETGSVDECNHNQIAWYIRESIKVDLFPRGRSKTKNAAVNGAGAADGVALAEHVQKAISFASAVRSRFSLLSVADEYLKPVWALIKSSLHQRTAARSSRSTSSLRSCIYICYLLYGVMEGTVDHLKTVDGDPHKLCALSFSALVQLDGTMYGMLKSLYNTLGAKLNLPLFNLLLAPVIAASVSLASHLGFYIKAQHRLEEVLSASSSTSLMPLAELLWSQLLHLRSSLPFGKQMSGSKRPAHKTRIWLPIEMSGSHQQITEKVALYGIGLHHLCLSGDWALLACWNDCAFQRSDIANKNTAKLKLQLVSLLRLGVSMGLQRNAMVQTPASLRRIHPESAHDEFTADFPRSVLVYGCHIKYLNLAWCQLRELPHSFGLHLPHLKTLDVSSNNLESLPDSFGELHHLDTCLANDNMLRGLPESFGNLSNLRKLQLCNNYLQSFPSQLRKLKQLEELQLRGNHFGMADSAQLTLLLPKLRVFVAPEIEGPAPVDLPTLMHLPMVNTTLAEPLKALWESMPRVDRDKHLSDVLENASSSFDVCLKTLGLSRRHCPSFYLKGICLARNCSYQHGDEDVDDQAAEEVVEILREGYEVEHAWAKRGETLMDISKWKLPLVG